MIDVILILLTLTVLMIASYTDIKTREVPDWLNFSLIATALGIRSIIATFQGFNVLLSGLLGFAVCFGLAFLFYYTNQWGGGDSKLLMGMGAIIGISLPFSAESLTLLWFFLSLLFIGAVWGLIWMVGVALRKRYLFITRFISSLKKNKIFHIFIATLTLSFIILAIFHPFTWPLILFPPLIFYLLIFVTSVEKSCFYVRKFPKDLTEGDWMSENVVVNGNKLLCRKTLTRKDLSLLINLKKKKKINTVLIKEGIPFVPSFLFAFIVITFLGKFVSEFIINLFG
jgi:Flp pilus assembly protein protease CpaA